MIGPQQIVNGMWMGTILILLGLPGLYQACCKAILRFANLLTLHAALPLRHLDLNESVVQPRWLKSAGFVVLLVTFLAYLC